MIKPEEYVLTDEKYVSLPDTLTVGKMFQNNSGQQVINMLLHFKYSICFEILKPQEESIQIISGNAQGNQNDQKLNKKIVVRKTTVAKMDNAPEKFFAK